MKTKLDFIAAHAAQHAIRLMCRMLSEPQLVPRLVRRRPGTSGAPGGARCIGYLKATLEAIAAGHPQSLINDLLPWAFDPVAS